MTVFNFSAGPAVLPVPVLLKAQSELLNYQGSGQSVLELSHRSGLFEHIIEETESLLRELLQIPDHYRVLFLQGGATLQFSMLPLNLATARQRVDFIDTGSWSQKAMQDAEVFCSDQCHCLFKSGPLSFDPDRCNPF